MVRWMRVLTAVMSVTVLALIAGSPAVSRRGGSFGSRGLRTYSAPRQTYGSGYVPPVQRSMTAPPAYQPGAGYAPAFTSRPAYPQGGSRFGGFGGGLLTGLIAGGFIGHLFGHGAPWGGAGGGGGFLISLIQLAIFTGIVWLVIGFFRRRSGYGAPTSQGFAAPPAYDPHPISGTWGGDSASAYDTQGVDIAITSADRQAFERLLIDVQDAFGREDYRSLRELTTPEMMSYLSEELGQNATQGVRNDVSGTRLIDAEVSEAWREADGDYATIVMRYESIDVMRDRHTRMIMSGATHVPIETAELWTFVRTVGAPWKLSAIQES